MPLFTMPSLKVPKLRGWPFVILLGLLLAVVAVIDRGGTGDQSTTAGCQLQVTTGPLNVRTGPSQRATLVQTLGAGTTVAGTSTLTDGFRQLQDGHWVSDQNVTPTAGSNCG